jgi:hypothetical protein
MRRMMIDQTPSLDPQQAAHFAALALGCIGREYPNHPGHVLNDGSDLKSPRALHPAFYGCFDWHSAVHGHWLLVWLLRHWPELPQAGAIRAALNENLTETNLLVEAAYLSQPNRRSFERPYGWTWLLKLAAELHGWLDDDGTAWLRRLQPLVEVIVSRYLEFFPRQTYPIRTGTHTNTAFGFAFALDYARAVSHLDLESMLVERSRAYFGNDRDYAATWEPGGNDFLSPALVEADLMARVLAPAEFQAWFHDFLPGARRGEPAALFTPATVSDRSDLQIVHLDGLNLSRAWCFYRIAGVLPGSEPARPLLLTAANAHAGEGLAHVASGQYAGEHWLASFAAYLAATKTSV